MTDRFLSDAAAKHQARDELDRVRLTLTGTRAALDLVQEECDDANAALDTAQQQLVEAGEMRRELARRTVEVRSERDSCREWGALAEDVTARLVAAVCRDESRYVHVARALWDTVGERDDARRALAEAEARGDEWSRVAHQWAQQRDDARRRAEEAERVIEAYRGFPLRDGLTLPEPATQGVDLMAAVGRAVDQARRDPKWAGVSVL